MGDVSIQIYFPLLIKAKLFPLMFELKLLGAAGFGVCCMFTLNECGGTVRQNCSYIQSEGFPTATTEEQTCTYNIDRISPSKFF